MIFLGIIWAVFIGIIGFIGVVLGAIATSAGWLLLAGVVVAIFGALLGADLTPAGFNVHHSTVASNEVAKDVVDPEIERLRAALRTGKLDGEIEKAIRRNDERRAS